MDEEQVKAIVNDILAQALTGINETQSLAQDLATRVQKIENEGSRVDEEAKAKKEHDEQVEKTNNELEGYMK
nr:MAG TPA: hypothetical protein [Caudoviricetes sp.]